MPISTQKIQVILEYVQKGLAKTRAGYRNFNQGMAVTTGRMKDLQTSQGKWNRRMGESKTRAGRMALGLRKATHGLRGFRMEMLGVMFFGMMLNRVFTGLLRTSMEWVGVNEIMTASLGILFLPVAEWVLEWAIKFLDWVLALTESQKKWIGSLVVLGAALGTALLIIGTFALGIGSLILVFNALTAPLALVIAAFGILAGYFILKDYFNGIAGASEKLNENLVAMGIPPGMIEKAKSKLGEFVGVIKVKIKEISEDVKLWTDAGMKIITNIITGIIKYLKANPLIIVGAIIGGLVGGPAAIAVGGAIGGLFGRLDLERRGEIIDKGVEILQGILTGLEENIDIISDFVSSLVQALSEWIGNNLDKFIKIGGEIAVAILSGLIAGLGNLVSKALGIETRTSATEVRKAMFSGGGRYQYGGIVPGRLGTPVPIIAHAGERITPVGRAGSAATIIINAEYNVTVSDKREFESMLRENNIKLTEDVRRIVKI